MKDRKPAWHVDQRGDAAELTLEGDWISRETGIRSEADLRRVLSEAGEAQQLKFNTAGLGNWDSALIVFLRELHNMALARAKPQLDLDLSGLPKIARRLLALATVDSVDISAGKPEVGLSLSAKIGIEAYRVWDEVVGAAELIGQTVLRAGPAVLGRTHTRAVDVLQLVREAGAEALIIIAIVNGLIGAVMAFIGAAQLRRFGGDIYVADLVGIAVVREMAAVMTAIVMAGRTGGAYAANLAAMQGNEEIDALKVLGIPIYDYLVLPRVTALVTMMPLLYLYACAVGLLGGFIVSVTMFDLTPTGFMHQLRSDLHVTQFVFGLVKSIACGILIAFAGCRIGLNAGRSAADVGRAATSAVVTGIVGVIVLDSIFAICANSLGI